MQRRAASAGMPLLPDVDHQFVAGALPSGAARSSYLLGLWTGAPVTAAAEREDLRELFARAPKLGSSAFTYVHVTASAECPLCDENGAPRLKGSGCNYFRVSLLGIRSPPLVLGVLTRSRDVHTQHQSRMDSINNVF